MGQASAKATSDITSVMNSAVDLFAEGVQDCNQAANTGIDLSQISDAGGSLDMHDITLDASTRMNQKCMSNFDFSEDSKQTVTEDFSQTATAINKDLNIGKNTTDAELTTRVMNNLSTVVNNSFSQAASQVSTDLLSASQFADCQKPGTCTPVQEVMYNISTDTYTDQIQDSVEKAVSKTSAYSQLQETIKSAATAENLGLNLNFLAAIIGAVVVLLAVLEYGGVKIVQGLTTTWPGALISIVAIYLVIAFMAGFFPFHKKEKTGADIKRGCIINSDCGDGLVCVDETCFLSCSTDDDCVFSGDVHMSSCIDGACQINDENGETDQE